MLRSEISTSHEGTVPVAVRRGGSRGDLEAGSRADVSRGATIYDVAREAGVATSTVSRAFSNPDRVNALTREHVEDVAQRLGYAPNPLARALHSGRTRTAALLVPDITNPHFFGIIRGAERRANTAGFTLVLVETEESGEREARHVERLTRGVDGFVLASSRMPSRVIREMGRSHLLSLVNREVSGVTSTVVDPADGSRQIVEHLHSLGHRSLVYLSGPRTSWLGARRWRFLSTSARRLHMRATRLGPFPPATYGGSPAADAGLGTGATALVAHNDLLAIGVLNRLATRGVSVPTDVSVVGYDNIFGSDFCSPPLTTVAGPFERAGASAVELLLASLETRNRTGAPRFVSLPSHLVVRASSGPPGRATTASRASE
ncbi:MAG: LacI family DNA-binding transcriptional regulator [Actinomycetes bacterium]